MTIFQKCELMVPYMVIKVVTVLWSFVNMFWNTCFLS